MSALQRMCLRMAACVALRNATIVGEAVFDSSVEATQFTDDMPVAGCISVFTEQSDGEALSEANGGPPFRPVVELVLEITMQARGAVLNPDGTPKEDADGNPVYEIGIPATDAQIEATVDLIEAQARAALWESLSPAAVLFRIAAKSARHEQSIRFVDPHGGARLAKRYVVFKVEISDFEAPVVMPNTPPPTGLARLPEPFASIAAAWPDGTPEKAMAANIAAALSLPAPPAFTTFVATAAPMPVSTPSGPESAPTQVETWTLPQ